MTKAKAQAQWHPKLKRFRDAVEKRKKITDVFVTPSFQIEYVNTGSTILNLLIGGSRITEGKSKGAFVCPGWPRGSIIEIFGREGSGKSTIAMTACGQALAQKEDACVLYVDLEHAVKDHYAMKLGCDFRPPELGGDGRAIRAAPHTFEETESIVMAAALNGVDVVVIDSVAGLVSKREAARDSTNDEEKVGIAEIPRLMSQWLPKLQAVIARTKTTVFFLNQTRDKIGVSSLAKAEETLKTTPGGNALKFWAALRLMLRPRLSAKASVYNPLLKRQENVQISTEIEVKMIKNKIDAKQGHAGIVAIRYGVGLDELRTMLTVAEAYGVVKKTKMKNNQISFSFKSPTDGKEVKGIGIEKFRVALQKNDRIDEMIQICTQHIIDGFRMIDDEQLAELAENAIVHDYGNEDEYVDGENPVVVDMEGVTLNDEGIPVDEDDAPDEDGESVETPSITADMVD